ncbi:S26 family signal peptidase [Actinomadura gamaensis]|uniref:S26 family signal peptidase n=1 Tax=Actinomadura gamaensis TaxID=1763541 RepID=A0ABV9U6T2_9ACTN
MGRTPLAFVLGAAGLAGAAVAAGAAAWTARRRLIVVTVEGRSMAPTFLDGDRVLVRRRSLADVRLGDVVVLEPPSTGEYLAAPPTNGPGRGRTVAWNVKRVVALPGDPVPDGVPGEGGTVPSGKLAVFGDNPDSVDSRQRGLYSGERLLGVVLRRLGGTRAGAVRDGSNRQWSPRSAPR